MQALRHNGRAIAYASTTLRADKEVILEALKTCPALEYASVDLKADKATVMRAVTNGGMQLIHASMKLREDKDVVMRAIKDDGEAFEYALGNMQSDVEALLTAVHGVATRQYAMHGAFNRHAKRRVASWLSRASFSVLVKLCAMSMIKQDSLRFVHRAMERETDRHEALVTELSIVSRHTRDVKTLCNIEHFVAALSAPKSLVGKRDRDAFERDMLCSSGD